MSIITILGGVGMMGQGIIRDLLSDRAIVSISEIRLCDSARGRMEALQAHLGERLCEEVRDIQQRLGITTLFVTHSQDEALSMADRIVVMRERKGGRSARRSNAIPLSG